MKDNFTIGVFAVIFKKDSEVLLCHRTDYDLWNLPGGALEEGETPWGGVIREVKEETGLDVKVVGLTGVYSKPKENDIVFQFLCEVLGGKTKLNKEADEIKYFSFNNLPENMPPKQTERIKDVLNEGGLALKKQTGETTAELIRKNNLQK